MISVSMNHNLDFTADLTFFHYLCSEEDFSGAANTSQENNCFFYRARRSL